MFNPSDHSLFFPRMVGELVSQYSFRKEEKSDFSPAFLNKFRILKALLESGVDLGCQFIVERKKKKPPKFHVFSLVY